MSGARWSDGQRAGARLLVFLEVVVAVVALAGITLAVFMIVADESSASDEWDGFGTFLAVLLLVVTVPTFVVTVVLAALTRSALRNEDASRLRTASVLGIALSAVGLVVAVLMSRSTGSFGSFVLALPALLIGAASLASLGVGGRPSDG